MFVRSASSHSGATCSIDFATGTDSPVRAASAIWSEALSATRQSAPTMSPSAKSTTSPRTSSSARHRLDPAAANDAHVARCEVAQCIDSTFGLALLPEPEHRVGDDDRRDHEGLDRGLVGTVEPPRQQRDDDRYEEERDQRIDELVEEPAPRWSRWFLVEFVRAELDQSPGRLVRGQSVVDVGAERAGDVVDRMRPRGRRPIVA